MLRIIQNKSAEGTQSYYSRSDYLTESQELAGHWGGKGTALLGLSGETKKDDFDKLCENRDPRSGERLTLRTRANRTVAYDFNFHVHKSVSIAYALGGDERIVDAFNQAVHETMDEIEQDVDVRVRKMNGNVDRKASNLVWAKFIHKTARPVDGVPDPHLHAHCVVLNAVFDNKENAWKAGNFKGLKRDAPYHEAAFEARFARNLRHLGYTIVQKEKGWELAEIPPSINDKFKRRTDQIEALAREKGVSNPVEKNELGAKSREKKVSGQSMSELRQIWDKRLTIEERKTLDSIRPGRLQTQRIDRDVAAEMASIEYAIAHSFERQAVIPEKRLMAAALKHKPGHVTLEGIRELLHQHPIITRTIDGQRLVTTPEILAEEKGILRYAKSGVGTVQPLNAQWQIKRHWMNADQKRAVTHVLNSRDTVSIIRGGAGTGKTTLMKEAIEGIEASGHRVMTFAPSAEASRGVLRSEGFDATTVAALLVSKDLQNEVAGQVIWVDEAGLLSSKQIASIFDIAKERDARVILSGDWAQHGSVERGSPLWMLENEKAITPAVEVAARLRVSKATAYVLVKHGRIACLRVGAGRGVIRIRESDLIAYEDSVRQQITVGRIDPKPVRLELKHIRLN